MSRPILHASDLSPASRPAFTKAVDLARRERAPLLLVHAMTRPAPPIGDGAYIAPETWDTLVRSQRRTTQARLDALVRRARAAGARARGLIVDGTPAEAILATARRRRAGTLVMGTHGRGGVARFVLGSVAGRVVAAARCPVLTVRGR